MSWSVQVIGVNAGRDVMLRTQVQTLFKSFAKDLEEAFRNAPCFSFPFLVLGSGLNTWIAAITRALVGSSWLGIPMTVALLVEHGWSVLNMCKNWQVLTGVQSEPWEFHTEQTRIHSHWLRLCHHHLSERWRMSQLVLAAQRANGRCVPKTATLK
jgi:hypothetical protein